MAERRYCQSCQAETLHDTFIDGLIVGERAPTAQRVFFGVFTFGFSEMIADKWRVCQQCVLKTKA